MAGLRINISGIGKAQKELKNYVSKKTQQLIDETNKAALNVERGAKQNAPVDTGRLRSSIHIVPAGSVDSDTGVKTGKEDAAVVTNVDYASIQEMKQPYMFPAWEAVRPDYIKRVSQILKGI